MQSHGQNQGLGGNFWQLCVRAQPKVNQSTSYIIKYSEAIGRTKLISS